MHELGIAHDLFSVVRGKAAEKGLKKVTKIRVKLGEASGIEPGLLRHSFYDHIFPGTIAQGAQLETMEEKVKVLCKDCDKMVSDSFDLEKAGSLLKCPHCGSGRVEVISGKDVYVDTIEGEK